MRHFIYLLMMLTLTVHSSAQIIEPNHINMKRKSMWPRNQQGITVINVCWENMSGSEREAQWVKSAIAATWGKEANVEFTGWGACGANSRGIRISVNNYGHPHCKGLGTDIDGMRNGMELNFTFQGQFKCYDERENCIKFIAAHEFGHALGLAHEHNRDDCQCSEPAQGSSGGWYVTPCDPNSIMNYCNPVWTNNGQLSENDAKGIQVIYGKKTVPNDGGGNGGTGGGGGGGGGTKGNGGTTAVSGSVTIKDQLGERQLYETVYLEFGGVAREFFVNQENPTDTEKFTIAKTGKYAYKIWSSTIYDDEKEYTGYGEGDIYLEAGKKYTLDMVIDSWNKAGYSNLKLIDRAATTEATVKSSGGVKPASLTLQNNTSGKIYIYWMDYDGNEKYYYELLPYKSYTQQTYIGHVWRIKNKGGKILQQLKVTQDRQSHAQD